MRVRACVCVCAKTENKAEMTHSLNYNTKSYDKTTTMCYEFPTLFVRPVPNLLVAAEEENLKHTLSFFSKSNFSSFRKQLGTVGNVAQTGVISAFVGDYFQLRINTRLLV